MHKSLSILITFCLSTFNYSQWDEIYSKNLIAEHFYQSVSTVFWSIWITCFRMSPLWHQLLEFYEIHFTSISSWTWLSNSTDHWLQLACRGNNQIFLLMSHKSTFQILDRQDLIKIGFQDIYFMFELRLRKGKKMRRRQGSGFENLLDHLFSFYSLLQVLKRKWEEDEEAALMNAKCLFPSNSLWWWILCPKDRSFSAIQIPLRPQQKMKVTIANYTLQWNSA